MIPFQESPRKTRKMMVQIICHRGWWETPEEQNTLTAFKRAFDGGLGVELDVRDCQKCVVVSHDPPTDDTETSGCMSGEYIERVIDICGDCTLAVNVKSSGLIPLIHPPHPKNWFFFDIPDAELDEYLEAGLPYFVREIESVPRSILKTTQKAAGVVNRVDRGLSTQWMTSNKKIMLLSPELYGQRSVKADWELIREWEHDNVLLLTDKPKEAREFFK